MRRVTFCVVLGFFFRAEGDENPEARPPASDAELQKWVANMMIDHRFSMDETRSATGLGESEIAGALEKLRQSNAQERKQQEGLKVLPYPGGRHPRIGFLDGAVRPQRETKISVFTPWDAKSYVVADVPEAVWWEREAPETEERGGRELLYLAHTHVPTFWTHQEIDLKRLEWKKGEDGSYVMRRLLPNRIEIGTKVLPKQDHVAMEQWITNGTDKTLTGLRVQNCVMLKGAPEFAALTNQNKQLENEPYALCSDGDGKRWLITAWQRCLRAWGNARCPCLHSDPQFPDCPPGKTVRVRGWLSFYQGTNIEAELKRIDATGWRE